MSNQPNTKQQLWQKIIDCDQQMLNHALQNNWPEIFKIQQQRDDNIREYFTLFKTEMSEQEMIEKIQLLQESNEQLAKLAKQQQDEIAGDIMSVKKGKGAAQQYGDIEKDSN